jgi:hypothetical protein
LISGNDTFRDAVIGINEWLVTLLDSSGNDKCVTGGPDVTWCSTEHNIDSYFSLHLAHYLVENESFLSAAKKIDRTLSNALWNLPQKRFMQGLNDNYRALDTQSWGTIWLQSKDQSPYSNLSFATSFSRSISSLKFADDFFLNTQVSVNHGVKATGYGPYADNSNSFHANTVWSEGTLGVALAYLRIGDSVTMKKIIQDLLPLVSSSGGVLYSANLTVVNNAADIFYPFPSVAGTGWMILTCSENQNFFWNANASVYRQANTALHA